MRVFERIRVRSNQIHHGWLDASTETLVEGVGCAEGSTTKSSWASRSVRSRTVPQDEIRDRAALARPNS